MKPPRDLLKIRRAMAKVPQAQTAADELAEVMAEAIKDIDVMLEVSNATEARMRQTLARYRARKSK